MDPVGYGDLASGGIVGKTMHETVYVATLVTTAQCGGPSTHAQIIGGGIEGGAPVVNLI